jgi:hypothetical protein
MIQWLTESGKRIVVMSGNRVFSIIIIASPLIIAGELAVGRRSR